jgi:O-antigen/teichoic acid export membrane protein
LVPELMAVLFSKERSGFSANRLGSSRANVVAFTIFGNAFTMACGAAGSVLAARLLGREGRGEIAAIFVWVLLIAAVCDIGISQSCSYFGAKSREPGAVVGTALALGEGSAIMAVVILIPLWGHIFGKELPETSLYLLTIPLSVAATYLSAVLQGGNRMTEYNFIRMIQAAVYPLGALTAWAAGLPTVQFVLLLVLLCQCAATVVTMLIAKVHLPLGEWQFSKPLVRQLYSYGIRCYSGNLFWLANGRLDQALLTFFAPMRDLGLYAVAVSYSGILFGLSGALATVLFPRIAGRSAGAGRREIVQMLRLLSAFSLPLAAIMYFGCPWVITKAFGVAFAGAIPPANVLLLGGAVLGVNYVLSNGLRAAGFPGSPALAEGAGLLVTLAALPLVLPRWGIVGAAWVSIGSYGLTAITLAALTVAKIKAERPESI